MRDARPPGFSGREVFVRIKAPRRPLTAGGVTQVVVSASKRAGIGEVTAHRLRHYVDGWVMWPAARFPLLGLTRVPVLAT